MLREKYISSRSQHPSISDIKLKTNISLSLIKVKLRVNKIKRDDPTYGHNVLTKMFDNWSNDRVYCQKQRNQQHFLENCLDYPCCLSFDINNPQVHFALLVFILFRVTYSLNKKDFCIKDPSFNDKNVLFGSKSPIQHNEWSLDFDDILKYWTKLFISDASFRRQLKNCPKHFLLKKYGMQYPVTFLFDGENVCNWMYLENEQQMMDIEKICECLNEYNRENSKIYKGFQFGKIYERIPPLTMSGTNYRMTKNITNDILEVLLPSFTARIYNETAKKWFLFDFKSIYEKMEYYGDRQSHSFSNYCISLIEADKIAVDDTDVYDLTYIACSMPYHSCSWSTY